MGYMRGLVTLTLVKEQLGVQFRQGALLVDQRLVSVSVPPCWNPYECFNELLWGLPGEPGLILYSLSHAASPCHRDSCSHWGGWDLVKQMQILNLLGAVFVSSPSVYRGRWDWNTRATSRLSLSLWLLTIPVSKSCQHTALCLPLAFCCGVHLEWLGTLLDPLDLAGTLKRCFIQY